MNSKRFTAMFLCFTICFATFFAYINWDTYAQNEETVYDYITIEDGKVVGGNAELLESGLIVVGSPEEENAASEDGFSAPSVSDEESTVPEEKSENESADIIAPEAPTHQESVSAGGAKAETIKDNAALLDEQAQTQTNSLPTEAPTAVNPDAPRPTIKATLSGVQNGLTCNTAANYNYDITAILSFKGPIRISGGANVTITGNGYDSTNGYDGIYRQCSGNLIEVNGGTLTINGKGGGNDRFIIDGVDAPVGTGTNYPNLTTSYDNGGGGTLIYLISGTVTLKNVQMRRNYNNANNGGGIYVAGGTLNVNGTLSCYELSTGKQGGFIYASGGTINYAAGGYVYQNSAARGGGFAITGSAKMTLGAASFFIGGDNGNTASEYGGGIYVNGGTVSVTNSSITNNKATGGGGRGGAIAVLSGSATIGNGVTLSGNTATVDGGALFAKGEDDPSKPGTINIQGGTITGNSAPQGGGAYASHDGVINMSGGTIESNSKAGVFLFSRGNLNMSGGTIRANTPNSYGGAGVSIYNNGTGKFIMSGSAVIKEHSGDANAHGVAQTGGGGTIEINGGTIESNHPSGGAGGGVLLECGTFTMTNGMIRNNTARWGGGVLARSSAASVSISGGTISGNQADLNGGGVMVESGSLTISGGTISDNKANGGTVSDGNTGKGGGVVTIVNTTISGNPVIKGNSASVDGGGIYVNGGTVNITGGEIDSNTAPHGGGLYVKKPGTINMSGGKVCNNKNGSGVFLYDGANFQLSGGEITNNTAGSHPGGGVAIYNNTNGTFTMTGGTISGHTASGHHGIAQTTGGGKLEIKGGTIKNNGSTSVNGGGIYASVGEVKISGGTIGVNGEPNTAEDGGGVYVNGSTLLEISENANIQYNTAATSGGGVVVNGTSTTFNFSGGSVSNNTNTGGNGGGLWIGELKSFSMTNGTVDNNTTAKSGGGMHFNRLITTNNGVTGGTITNNTAGIFGGGIYVGNYGGSLSLSVKNATISQNKAQNGGGIAAIEEDLYPYQVELSVDNCTVIKNSAMVNGGGIVLNASSIALTDCIIGDSTNGGNRCGNSGGGLYATANCGVNITGGSFSSNVASGGNGGGICLENITTTATVSGTTFHLNTALFETPDETTDSNGNYNLASISSTGNGGAIYVYGENSVVEISDAKIGDTVQSGYSNQAVNGGGIAVMRGATAIVTSSTVAYNYALRTGGGYYVLGCGGGDPTVTTTLRLVGGKVESNRAEGSTNYTGSSPAGAAISGLGSEMGGGGFYLRGLSKWEGKTITVDIDGTVINSNSAYRGAAMYVHENANVTVKNNASFTKNNAGGLGGVLCFMRNSSTVDFTSCSFTENYAGLRGGALYIQKPGVSVTNCIFTDNNAEKFGGAIMLRDTTNSSITFAITNTDFVGNSSNNGGAISTSDGATNAYNMILNLTNCNFRGNSATANGGAVLVGGKTAFNMTGGYLTGNTAGTDESGIMPIADNNRGVGVTGVAGAGGAVAVFDGAFSHTVNATNKGAIYGNTATTVGDDVFSNGSSTSKLSLPKVSDMDLSEAGFAEGDIVDWHEDYAKGEASGMNPNILSSERYRSSDNTIWASLNDINTQGKYVAVTIGISINLGELVIVKSGDDVDSDQVFVFEISGVAERSGAPIFITVSIKGTGSVKIVDIPVGNYTVRELTSWSWRYGVTTIEVDENTVQFSDSGVEITVDPNNIDHSVEFVNSLENQKWLSHGTAPIKNVPTNGTVAYSTVVLDLPKQKTV